MLLTEMYEKGSTQLFEETSADKDVRSGSHARAKEKNPTVVTSEDRKIINSGIRSISFKGFDPKKENTARGVCSQIETVANKVSEKNWPTMQYLANRIGAMFKEIGENKLVGGKGDSRTMAYIWVKGIEGNRIRYWGTFQFKKGEKDSVKVIYEYND